MNVKYMVTFDFMAEDGNWHHDFLNNNEEGLTDEAALDLARELRMRGHRNVKIEYTLAKEDQDMYMSYCRFEGTRMELRACLGSIEEHEYAISDREIEHFRRMVEEFHGWLKDMCIIDDNGDIDEDELDQVCMSMEMEQEAEEANW